MWTDDGLAAYLAERGIGADHAAAANDHKWDSVLRAETAEALERVGPDLGTPIITLDPPYGPSFFGPVMSAIPRGDDAIELWDAFEVMARTPGIG